MNIARDHFIPEKQGRNAPDMLRSTTSGSILHLASTQAVQSNGERVKRLPWCTVVSGQIDLNTGGAWSSFF
jgi:hypothetical protein